MLGFAMRAGKLALGTDTVIASMKAKGQGRARLVLISADASEGTAKRLGCKAEYYNIPLRMIDVSCEVLGETLGKSYAPIAISVTDDNFAREIIKAIEPADQER